MEFGLVAADTWIMGTSLLSILAFIVSSVWIAGILWLIVTEGTLKKLLQLRLGIKVIIMLLLGGFLLSGLAVDHGAPGYVLGAIALLLTASVIAFSKLNILAQVQSALCSFIALFFTWEVIRYSIIGLAIAPRDAALHIIGGPNPGLVFLGAAAVGLLAGWLSRQAGLRLPQSNRWLAALFQVLMPGGGLIYLSFFVYGPLLMVLEAGVFGIIAALTESLPKLVFYVAIATIHFAIGIGHVFLIKKITAIQEPAIFSPSQNPSVQV